MTDLNKKPSETTANWSEQKTKLKSKFTQLTDADLHFEPGKKEEMLSKVQAKLGKNQEDFNKIMHEL